MNLNLSENSETCAERSRSTTNIQSAGRVLSSRNANRMKSAMDTLLEMMIDANVFNAEDVNAVLQKIAAQPESSPSEEKSTEKDEQVQAGRFKLDVQFLTWSDRLQSTLSIFRQRFESLHNLPDNALNLEGNQTRSEAQKEILNDLTDVLLSLSEDYPTQHIPSFYATMASSVEEVLEKDDSTHVIAFDCPATRTEINAAGQDGKSEYNKRPIQGVLFRIDEPSEAIPAVGPGLPLYIPLNVAEQTLSCISGLPLDAHDSLSRHANNEIAGVIQSAEIKGQDYCVSGYMWPWSQSQKVQAISKNIDRLGMSMNAAAKGRTAEVDGKKVFWVDHLQLLGANILYSDRATFRKTRLVAAQAFEDSENALISAVMSETNNGSHSLAASSEQAEDSDANSLDTLTDDPSTMFGMNQIASEQLEEVSTAEENTMPLQYSQPEQTDLNKQQEEKMSQEILTQLSALTNSVNGTLDEFKGSIKTLNERQDAIVAQLNEVRADLDQRRAAIQASEAERVRVADQEKMALAIQEAVNKAMNPSGAPARKTFSVAASSMTPAEAPVSSIELQLAAINGEMKALQDSPRGNGVRMMQLLDQKRNLEYQQANS